MAECAERCEVAMSLVRATEAQYSGRDYNSDSWLSSMLMEAMSEAQWSTLDREWFKLTTGTVKAMAEYVRAKMINDDRPHRGFGK